jgi:hypothetical protein
MKQTELMREKLFNVRMDAAEYARLQALAKHLGLPAANAVRMLIKRECDALKIGAPTMAAPVPVKRPARTRNPYVALAQSLARDANEEHFESRRGVWTLEQAPGVVCVYNNNPYAGDPERRDREIADLHARMVAGGYQELATASYPAEGVEQAGYTITMLVRLPDGKTGDDLAELYSAVTMASFDAAKSDTKIDRN